MDIFQQQEFVAFLPRMLQLPRVCITTCQTLCFSILILQFWERGNPTGPDGVVCLLLAQPSIARWAGSLNGNMDSFPLRHVRCSPQGMG